MNSSRKVIAERSFSRSLTRARAGSSTVSCPRSHKRAAERTGAISSKRTAKLVGATARMQPGRASRGLRRLTLFLLAGYLLFCHGCHGDEDNELLAQCGISTRNGSGTVVGKPLTAALLGSAFEDSARLRISILESS